MPEIGKLPFDIEKDFIPVFKTGNYPQMITEMNPAGVLDISIINQLAQSYDLKRYIASLTTDHTFWGPRLGSVAEVKTEGETLFVRFESVDDDFASEVKKGRWLYPSVELIPPQDMGNPSPGNWYLGAVTFLGAGEPQVKGLYHKDKFLKPFVFEVSDDKGHKSRRWCISERDAYTKEVTTMPEPIKPDPAIEALRVEFGAKIDTLQGKVDTLTTENVSYKAANASLTTRLDGVNAERVAEKKAATEKRITDFCAEMKADGWYPPAVVDAQVKPSLDKVVDSPEALDTLLTSFRSLSKKGSVFTKDGKPVTASPDPSGASDSETTSAMSTISDSGVAKVGNLDASRAMDKHIAEFSKDKSLSKAQVYAKAYKAALAEAGGGVS